MRVVKESGLGGQAVGKSQVRMVKEPGLGGQAVGRSQEGWGYGDEQLVCSSPLFACSRPMTVG